ncbi:hypothetical protein L6452_26155 [Arctium lappa]|uniref:Uncharacterized protein n=1 Tax=Arctium lappa TaxID=4217 RepID=A0ACB9ACT3_ARCLA|nr:hypothetical protein L6452_26155 [Arctium lappa]
MSTKADNSELQGLKDIVSLLQKDVSVNTQVLCDLKSKADRQTHLLDDILQQLKTPHPPSFTEDYLLAQDMVTKFGTMAISAIHDLETKEQARSQVEAVTTHSRAEVEADNLHKLRGEQEDEEEEEDVEITLTVSSIPARTEPTHISPQAADDEVED